MDKPAPIRIVLAEDQSIIRQGLSYIINTQQDMTVVGEAVDGDEAIQTTMHMLPDLVLMDIRMPKRDGIEATSAILATLPDTKIVLLTTFDIQEYVFKGIRAGAVGFLLKDADTSVLLAGIRAAQQGAIMYHSHTSAQALAEAMQARHENIPSQDQTNTLLEPLTEREREVLQQMAFGQRNQKIAHILNVSEGTVKTHVHRILQKFGVEDRTQAVVMALRQRLVE
ncbi:putative transcriptional regulatory protein YxjL [Dictyobacter alpinus]|uniref:Putative transcriptional regulatory protein YxjL n=1 Tax=Dictyobacter alpinus TaxID=2014873 RepID=A0A402BBU0_9CHLR|nr:response regulator transcription factor [Dictyobacter alpinus]GCE28815.1 putative transcriptional regulatory protein YxjL [Dictyobacter alpinus]